MEKHCVKFNHKSEDCRIAKNKLQKEVKPTGLTSLKGLKVSPFNESDNSKGVKVKPLIDRNHFVEKKKGIKVNPLSDVKISPETESDHMENYKPFISEGEKESESENSERYWSNSVPQIVYCLLQKIVLLVQMYLFQG